MKLARTMPAILLLISRGTDMAKRKDKGKWDLEPQKSSAAQFLTYIASTGASDEKFEIRYEDENIWMSQKMLAAVYGVDLRTVSYHVNKIFKDA